MKKHFRLAAIAMVLALLLAGCGNTNTSNNSNTFNRSAGLDDNGYWKDIKASDYVELCDTSKIEIQQSEIDESINSLLVNFPSTLTVKDRAVIDGDVVRGSVMAGQVCGQLKEIRPVADILKSLYEDAKTVLKKAGETDL